MQEDNNQSVAEKIESSCTVELVGKFSETVHFSHEMFGERFYRIFIKVERLIKFVDEIPVLVSERLCDLNVYKGRKVRVTGGYRSRNALGEDGKRHLFLNVFAYEVEQVDKSIEDMNKIFIDGYICKKSSLRMMPLKRIMIDIMVAVNRPYGKSDYIPCIAWDRNARYTENFSIGQRIKLKGRIQSRPYVNSVGENGIAYEVSISKVKAVQ